MQQLILIGDSIRMGYQADVIRELTELADVWAPTQNGGNSANIPSTSRRVDYFSVVQCRPYQLWAARPEKGFRYR